MYELGLFKDCPRRDDWSSLFLSVFCGITLCHRKSFHSTVWQLPLLVERRLVALLLFVQSFPLIKSQSLFLQTAFFLFCPNCAFEASSIKELGHLSMSRSGKRVKAIPPRHSASFSFSCEGGAFLTGSD